MNKLLLFLFLLSSTVSIGQEVNATITVDASQLPVADKEIFDQMEETLNEFVNNRRWTKDNFSDNERIEFSILLTLSSSSGNSYSGNLQVQSRRPVYNSGYYTNVLSYKDQDIEFEFSRFAVLEYSENSFMSNLSSLIAFYTYMVIGYDYDTFSENGGTEFFNKAREIVQYSQSAGGKGWQSSGKRNRYWMVDDHLNSRYAALRKAIYLYHRQGMDQMADNPAKGREGITAALEEMKKVHVFQPNSFSAQIFFNAKNKEIVKIYQEATKEEKEKVMEILSTVDAANLVTYQKINE